MSPVQFGLVKTASKDDWCPEPLLWGRKSWGWFSHSRRFQRAPLTVLSIAPHPCIPFPILEFSPYLTVAWICRMLIYGIHVVKHRTSESFASAGVDALLALTEDCSIIAVDVTQQIRLGSASSLGACSQCCPAVPVFPVVDEI
jgi:hypothetical protein